jgi:phosphoribosyl 1,2-cyclic phosphate phosphodiesterase
VVVRWVDGDGTERTVLIDASPELRLQAVRHGLDRLDAVLYTHAHADHTFGTDDLRRFNAVMKAPLDVYAEPDVLEQLGRMFGHIFEAHKNINPSFVASLIPHQLAVDEAFELRGATVTPVRLMHGRLPIVGYRFDVGDASLAYCTDVSNIPPQSYPLLEGLDVLVLDALRPRHHPTHLTVDQALGIIAELRPGRAYLTHIAHDLSHEQMLERMPHGVEPAWDGLETRVKDEG